MRRLLAVLAISGVSASAACSDDADYVRVLVTTRDPSVASSQLDLRVLLSGGAKMSEFKYQAQPKRGATPSELSDFILTFPENAPTEVDVRVVVRPGGQAVDWGGDLRVQLPGGQRSLPLALSAGESTPIPDVRPLDSDTQSIAAYGQQVALAWPSTIGGIKTAPVSLDRVEAGVSRVVVQGKAPKKVRVTSRPSTGFSSEVYVTSWIEEDVQPVLLIIRRNSSTETRAQLEKLPGITDLHVAIDPKTSSVAPIVSAALSDNRVVLYTHDVDGNLVAGPSPNLEPITGLAGIAVTPNETVTIVVKGNPGRLIQASLKPESFGAKVAEVPLAGTPVAMTLSADLSRILVATVKDVGDREKGTLELQAFSAANPSPSGPPARVARYPFVIGDPAGRVALSSCAIAWPEQRADGTARTDVWFRRLGTDQNPTGDPHVVNVSQLDHHWAPSLACIRTDHIVATMYAGADLRGNTAALAIRELPDP